jgi:hypothetical protein
MSQQQQETEPGQGTSVELARITAERALHRFDGGVFDSHAALTHFTRVAEIFAKSSFVPQELRGNTANCLIALNMAQRMREDPLAVMQMIHFIKGRPGFSAKFQIARANSLAGWKTNIRWKIERLSPATLEGEALRGAKDNKRKVKLQFENLRVTAHAVDENGEVIEASVTTALAISDGWIDNEKYEHDMENMLVMRSSTRLVGRYAPGVMLGLRTVEELETEPQQVELVEQRNGDQGQSLMDRIAAGVPAAQVVDVEVEDEGPVRRVDTPLPTTIAPVQVPPELADLVPEPKPKAGQDTLDAATIRKAVADQQKPAEVAPAAAEGDSGEPELAKLNAESLASLEKWASSMGVPAAKRGGLAIGNTRPGCYDQVELRAALKAEMKEGLPRPSGAV